MTKIYLMILWYLARKYWNQEEDNDGQIVFYTDEYTEAGKQKNTAWSDSMIEQLEKFRKV